MSKIDEAKLTAYALGELDAAQAAEVEAYLAAHPAAGAEVDEIRQMGSTLRAELAKEQAAVSPTARSVSKADAVTKSAPPVGLAASDVRKKPSRFLQLRWAFAAVAATVVLAVGAGVIYKATQKPRGVDLTGGTVVVDGLAYQEAQVKSVPGRPYMPQPDSTVLAKKPGDGSVAVPASPQPIVLSSLRGGETSRDGRLSSEMRPGDHGARYADVGWEDVSAEHPHNAEAYAAVWDNKFQRASQAPLSTFSIDVDTASYTNVRRMLMQNNQLPPAEAVRIEEMINYFRYDYPKVSSKHPVAAFVDVTACPWNTKHRLARVGIVGKSIEQSQRPPMNLVFLLDVSGSMSDSNKLPLVKQAMTELVDKLTDKDSVGIVTYAGSSGVHLQSLVADEGNRGRIKESIAQLQSGGSTNGGSGIELAYQQAVHNQLKEGVNRVILCTDGDFNVGTTNREALIKMIQQKAKSGVFLTVLGFGMGNIKDATLEQLADKGNGSYGYIDSAEEARRQLVDGLMGTLVTVAKDVKLQIEFNPAKVAGYRLIGYENRMLATEDFNNDKKDAGEIGAGQTVTALYELVPAGQPLPEELAEAGTEDMPLRYQTTTKPAASTRPARGEDARASFPESDFADELMAVKIRYKRPDLDKSVLMQQPVKDEVVALDKAPSDVRFAASVAAFGMILRHSQYVGDYTLDKVENMADGALGEDTDGKRLEFVKLVHKARELSKH